MILRLLLLLAFCGLAPSIARAQSCSVTPSNLTFNPVDVLANVAVDVSGTINFSCSGVALLQGRMCLSIGDPNGEAGGNRIATNGANQIRYDLYTDAARTQRWSSWFTGTGSGLQVDFTFPLFGAYSGSVPIYGRVFSGQQTAAGGVTFTETFTNTQANLFVAVNQAVLGLNGSCAVTVSGSTSWTTPMVVSIVVPKKCLVTGNTLNFGTVGTLAANVDASTNLSVSCSNTVAYSISLGNGQNGTSATTRKMKNGVNTVDYSLYRDAGRTQTWGSTIGTDTASGTGSGNAVSVPVYARVPVQSTPAQGTYNDSVVITVTY